MDKKAIDRDFEDLLRRSKETDKKIRELQKEMETYGQQAYLEEERLRTQREFMWAMAASRPRRRKR